MIDLIMLTIAKLYDIEIIVQRQSEHFHNFFPFGDFEMETVVLKNGAKEAETVVITTMMSLRHLVDSEPLTFYELVAKCRDNNHQLFGNTGEKLKNLALVQSDESIPDTVRNIVLSAIEGEGLKMSLGSPITH